MTSKLKFQLLGRSQPCGMPNRSVRPFVWIQQLRFWLNLMLGHFTKFVNKFQF